MNNAIIELCNVNKTYLFNDIKANILHNINLKIIYGEFVAIIGTSGSGKTSLLNILGLLNKSYTGSYKLFGIDTSTCSDDNFAVLRNDYLGFIFQNFNHLNNFTVIENINLPLIYSTNKNNDEKKIKYKENLKLFLNNNLGISKYLNHKPNEISGGQQQRVAIARAISNNPLIILADEPTGNLDKETAKGVINIFKKINKLGTTIIMVTHENSIITDDMRKIEIKDGAIIHDNGNNSVNKPTINITIKNINKKTFSLFKIKNYLKESIKYIYTKKTQTIISILGILFGTASLITTLNIGNVIKKSIKKSFNDIGAKNLLVVYKEKYNGIDFVIKKSDINNIKNQINEITDVAGCKSIPGHCMLQTMFTTHATTRMPRSIWGLSSECYNLGIITIHKGRFFTKQENELNKKVVLLEKQIVEKLYGKKNFNPIGMYIKINNMLFKIIGVFSSKQYNRTFDSSIFIPINLGLRINFHTEDHSYNAIDYLFVKVKNGSNIKNISNYIKEKLMSVHGIHNCIELKNTIIVNNLTEYGKTLTSLTKILSIFFTSMTIIILLIGEICMMNVMFVSVSERIIEIGVKKSIGAKNNDILLQFIINGLIICCIGIFPGIITGVVTSCLLIKKILNIIHLTDVNTHITITSIFVSFFLSIFFGLVFCILPAIKAAKLDPVDALKH
ncbi:MAG: ATP-binding cassette domain-containing protein [Endomicrobium sp.]|jgi:macrolide transport system ATP-binding/permease protein|nr:ATP-binding cassette domain-containing protein [Endomicrobium sp.]